MGVTVTASLLTRAQALGFWSRPCCDLGATGDGPSPQGRSSFGLLWGPRHAPPAHPPARAYRRDNQDLPRKGVTCKTPCHWLVYLPSTHKELTIKWSFLLAFLVVGMRQRDTDRVAGTQGWGGGPCGARPAVCQRPRPGGPAGADATAQPSSARVPLPVMAQCPQVHVDRGGVRAGRALERERQGSPDTRHTCGSTSVSAQ